MALTLPESQVCSELAGLLYEFLPGKPNPWADPGISFLGVAQALGIASYWPQGSKRPSITTLLAKTLELRRDLFCPLILGIVRKGINYRSSKGNPITQEEIRRLNQLIARVQFKIPDLWDPAFLSSLPTREPKPAPKPPVEGKLDLAALQQKFLELAAMPPQARGFAFEVFLKDLFESAGLAPRSSFRLVGEQIDGSFQLEGSTYLLEAKWQSTLTANAELLAFRGKVEAKSAWTRGLIISYSGFSPDGLIAFSRGRSTNIIAMIGQDLHFILEGQMSIVEALLLKTRRAAETGEVLVTVHELALRM